MKHVDPIAEADARHHSRRARTRRMYDVVDGLFYVAIALGALLVLARALEAISSQLG